MYLYEIETLCYVESSSSTLPVLLKHFGFVMQIEILNFFVDGSANFNASFCMSLHMGGKCMAVISSELVEASSFNCVSLK